MTLVEVLVSASVFAISSSASLQLWAAGSSWSQRAEQQRAQQGQHEAALLAAEGELHVQAELLRSAWLAGPPAAVPTCAAAAAALLDQWSAPAARAGGPAQLAARDGGLLLTVPAAAGNPSRQRWFHPAAFGLCGERPQP